MNITNGLLAKTLKAVMINHQILLNFGAFSHIRPSQLIQLPLMTTPYTITEDSVRGQLQLADDGGIDDLPIANIYSGMDNLGYVTEGQLNFEGQPMPLLAAMLSQAGEGAWVVAPTIPQIIPEPIPEPMPKTDQPQDHLTAPPRQQTSDPIALVFEHGQISTLVQKVNYLEIELKAHKKLFKDVVGKLVKQVKAICGFGCSTCIANALVTVESTKISWMVLLVHPASLYLISHYLLIFLLFLFPSLLKNTNSFWNGTTTATYLHQPVKRFQKGKGVAVEEPTPTHDKTFKQLEEERLGWEAAQRLQAQELAD
ncbi:hypothetical protein Tco_1336005 [Tanacetum coccineum]